MESLIQQLKQGMPEARDKLIEVLMTRFRNTASRLLGQNPRIGRWESTDDLMQQTLMRLYHSLEDVQPETPRELFGLARLHFSRELTDLARKHYGPLGIGQNHATNHAQSDGKRQDLERQCETHNPSKLSEWLEFHEVIESLDEPVKEVFQMCWYKLMTHAEMADFLGCSTKTIQRRYRQGCLAIRKAFHAPPGED